MASEQPKSPADTSRATNDGGSEPELGTQRRDLRVPETTDSLDADMTDPRIVRIRDENGIEMHDLTFMVERPSASEQNNLQVSINLAELGQVTITRTTANGQENTNTNDEVLHPIRRRTSMASTLVPETDRSDAVPETDRSAAVFGTTRSRTRGERHISYRCCCVTTVSSVILVITGVGVVAVLAMTGTGPFSDGGYTAVVEPPYGDPPQPSEGRDSPAPGWGHATTTFEVGDGGFSGPDQTMTWRIEQHDDGRAPTVTEVTGLPDPTTLSAEADEEDSGEDDEENSGEDDEEDSGEDDP